MIVGTSRDGKVVATYRNREDYFDTVEVDWLNGECLSDLYGDLEDPDGGRYELVNYQHEMLYIEDDWHEGLGNRLGNESMNVLIECDYCESKFVSSWNTRRNKAVKYLSYFYEKDKSHLSNTEKIDLYKDNCAECVNLRSRETSMINNGFYHISQTEGFKDILMDAFQKHNMVPTSRGQRYIAKMFNSELNVRKGNYFVDMLLDEKIVIEYDGGGHNLKVLTGQMSQEEFDIEESERSEFLFSKGYKLLRFISPEELFPEDENYTKSIICEAISELYLSDKQEIHISMGRRVDDRVHGKLIPIKRLLEKSEWGEELL